MNKLFLFVSILLVTEIYSLPNNRRSSSPYISGDGFRSICKYKHDELTTFNPKNIKKPSIIFIKGDMQESFFKDKFPKLKFPCILVVHNSDDASPGEFYPYLEDPKIIHWFGQNPTIKHEKFTAIPIGIGNKCWPHGNVDIFDHVRNGLKKNNIYKDHLFYININYTHPSRKIFESILKQNKDFHKFFNERNVSVEHYLTSLASSLCAACPKGNGLDTHRTWECLLVDTIPVVETSYLDQIFEDLPVIIIKDWHNISETFLLEKLREVLNTTYNEEKIYLNYWKNKITSFLPE